MPKIAMNELTTYRWSFEEDVHHIRSAGYDGIGIWRHKLSDFGEERGAELVHESGLEVSSLHWAGGFTGSDGRSFVESVDDALEAVYLAGELDAPLLFVHSGGRGLLTRNHARRLFVNALHQMLPLAEEQGVRLAIEPMRCPCARQWTCIGDLDDVIRLIDSFDSSQVALALDCYHLLHDRSILDRFDGLAERVAIVQLADAVAPPDEEPDRRLLGHGTLPLGEAVTRLKAAGYDGYYEIELMGADIELLDYHQILSQSRQAAEALLNIYAEAR